MDSLSLEIVTLESLELSSRLDEKFEEAERKIYANPGVYPELRLDIPEKEWRPLVYREELTPGKRQPEPTSQQVIPATNKTLAQPGESKSQAANPQRHAECRQYGIAERSIDAVARVASHGRLCVLGSFGRTGAAVQSRRIHGRVQHQPELLQRHDDRGLRNRAGDRPVGH